MNPDLTIHELLRSHYIPAKMDLSDATGVWMTGAVNLLGEFLARTAVVPDLSDMTSCRFMRWLMDNGRSARTANSRRCGLLTLWRFAFRKGMILKLPQEVPKAKEPRRVPTSWTDQQFSQIICGCEQYQDATTGKILKAVLLTAWDTDCRIGAIMACSLSSFSAERRSLVLYETKTRTEHVHYLSVSTVQAIQSLPLTTTRLFGWSLNIQDLRDHLTAILKAAGLPASPKDKFHKVRRTKFTAVFKMHGLNAASAHAGHTTDMSRYYLDTRALVLDDLSKSLPPPPAG